MPVPPAPKTHLFMSVDTSKIWLFFIGIWNHRLSTLFENDIKFCKYENSQENRKNHKTLNSWESLKRKNQNYENYENMRIRRKFKILITVNDFLYMNYEKTPGTGRVFILYMTY